MASTVQTPESMSLHLRKLLYAFIKYSTCTSHRGEPGALPSPDFQGVPKVDKRLGVSSIDITLWVWS
ncbi:hypothetical protein DAI22_04g155450 [Oryza sativa Japonica Group]|nr:hypothetical protein DAI22_04g155450 [Oryza sativa Japonica Group]